VVSGRCRDGKIVRDGLFPDQGRGRWTLLLLSNSFGQKSAKARLHRRVADGCFARRELKPPPTAPAHLGFVHCGRRTSFLAEASSESSLALTALNSLSVSAVRPQPRDFLKLLDEFRR
jgi:hypothetical protein